MFDAAVERGWIGKNQVPQMKNKGAKGTPREAFSLSEYNSLTSYMPTWAKKGHMVKTIHMRELLRDYVLILANTGSREHGEKVDTVALIPHMLNAFITRDRVFKSMCSVDPGPKRPSKIGLDVR